MAANLSAAVDYSCGYCMQLLKNMSDPRELPCGHVCCLSCLRDDYSAGGTDTQCPQCSEVHKNLQLDELPEVEQKGEVKGIVSKLPKIPCSRCAKAAICFCKDCNAKMCTDHKQAHDGFLGETHSYVPFDEYRRLPKKYEKPECTRGHKRYLTLACEVCDLVACEDCDLTTTCTNHGTQHKFRSLAKSEVKFAENYGSLIGDISSRHSEFSKKQKETERLFGDLVAGYNEEEKLKAIDQMAELQIAEIKRRAERRKKEIQKFPNKMDEEVTTYSEGLSKKEQQLGDLEKSLTKQLRDNHITDVIQANKNNQKDIAAAQELTTGNCGILRRMVVAPSGLMPDVGAQLRALIPTKLEKFFNGSSTAQQANILVLTDQGGMIYYFNSQLVVTGLHIQQRLSSFSLDNVVSLAQWRDKVFVGTYRGKCLTVDMYDYLLKHEKQICSFATERSASQLMIARENQLIVINNSSYNYGLHVYDLSGKLVRNVRLDQQPSQICSLPDGYVLIMDGNGYLIKYDITSTVGVAVWTSQSAHSCVSTDSVGLIYCSQSDYNSHQKIRFYSPDLNEGKMFKRVIEVTERRYVNAIDVKNNVMAVRDGNSYINLYHITY